MSALFCLFLGGKMKKFLLLFGFYGLLQYTECLFLQEQDKINMDRHKQEIFEIDQNHSKTTFCRGSQCKKNYFRHGETIFTFHKIKLKDSNPYQYVVAISGAMPSSEDDSVKRAGIGAWEHRLNSHLVGSHRVPSKELMKLDTFTKQIQFLEKLLVKLEGRNRNRRRHRSRRHYSFRLNSNVNRGQ